MDKIRIWFKNEWASKYIENVTEWKFETDYLVIKSKEGIYFVSTDTIHYLIIGSMDEKDMKEDFFPFCPTCNRITDPGCVESCDVFKELTGKED